MAVVLALAWAALVTGRARRCPRPPDRVRALTAPPGATGDPGRPATGKAAVMGVGRLVLRAFRRPHQSTDVEARVGTAALASVVVAVRWPAAVVAVVAVAWAAPVVRARREARRREAAVLDTLPDVVDLLVLAVAAGLNVRLAVAAVARHGSGPVAEELGRASAAVERGCRLADALDELPVRLGEPVRPLVTALVASDRYGAPLAAGLERLADETRRMRRRRAEEAARRIPVKLLFPLVLGTLPAFALLTVAPLVAGALRLLRP